MGTVISLREPRPDLPHHPALRWLAGEAYWVAHRRDPDTRHPVCGADGELVLASQHVPLCPTCYPGRAIA